MTPEEIEAIEWLFRFLDSSDGGNSLEICPVENDETGEHAFESWTDDGTIVGYGVTSLGSVVDLAKQLSANVSNER